MFSVPIDIKNDIIYIKYIAIHYVRTFIQLLIGGIMFKKDLDRKIPIPLYFQLKNIILDDIKTGEYKVGDMIPTENDISDFYQISRSTVRQAIVELVQEGWLIRKASKGTFVIDPTKSTSLIRSFEPFYRQISRLGKTPKTELLDLRVITPSADLIKSMKLSADNKVISMFRRRFADDVPMMTIQNYIPYDVGAFILSYDFTSYSLYELLMNNPATKINETRTIVSAELATKQDMSLLNVKVTTPMLVFNNVSTTSTGKIIDFAFAHYHGDFNKFEYVDSPESHSSSPGKVSE